MSRDGSPEVDVSVPILAVQRAPDVGMEVQVEGLQLLVEALQILREGGRVIPGAPVGPCVREAWGVALGVQFRPQALAPPPPPPQLSPGHSPGSGPVYPPAHCKGKLGGYCSQFSNYGCSNSS